MKQELIEKIESLNEEAKSRLPTLKNLRETQDFKISLLGKKGSLTEVLKNLGSLSPADRPAVGQKVNQVKQELEAAFDSLQKQLEKKEQAESLKKSALDISLPADPVVLGHLHPMTQVQKEIEDIFLRLGFSIHEGPEVETDYYNFEALNVPANHPARDMQDTFFVKSQNPNSKSQMLLRTHTSPVQIHVMERQKPPIYMIAPGAVYRRDNDISHSPMFNQIAGLMVDTHITFKDLKGVLSLVCHEIFGADLKVRFRPSFFPFTEPSAEVDIECVICGGKGKGCRVCKESGFLEILGCG